MRRFWLPFALALVAGWPAAFPTGWATAQEDRASQEPVTPEALDKLTVALDPGGHTGPITYLHFTPDAKHLITGSTDRTVRIWDLVSGRTVRVLRPSGFSCVVMALSPDGQRLAVGAGHYGAKATYVIYMVDLADGKIDRVLTEPRAWVDALAFSGNGKHLAWAEGNKTVRVWDIAKGQVEQSWEPGDRVKGLAFSRDGGRLALQTALGVVSVRNIADGKTVADLKGTPRGVPWNTGLAWSPDGRTIAVCDLDGVHLWAADGKSTPKDVFKHRAESVTFSTDSGRVLAVWNDPEPHAAARATVLDVKTGKEMTVFTALKSVIGLRYGALSPDGSLAATAARNGVISVWNTKDGAPVKRLERLGAVGWLTGDDLRAGWAADSKTVSWRPVDDPDSWKGGPTSFDLGKLQFGALGAAQSHGAVVQRGPLSLKKVDALNVQVLKDDKPLTRLFVEGHQLHSMTLLGKAQVALGAGSWLFVADATNPRFVQKCRHEAEVISLAPSPDGRYLVTLSEDQKLRVFADRNEPLLTLYVHGRDWIAWTPKGYYAATPGGERLMGWVVDNGPEKLGTYYPAQRFRKVLYRPDVIERLLKERSLEDALAAANAARARPGEKVGGGVADLEQLLPPQATLDVVDKTALPKVTVKATGKAAAVEGQPVKSLRLLVDGRPLPDGQGVLELEQEQGKAEAEWTVTLPPGEHELKVLARGPNTAGVSAAVVVPVPVPAAAPRPALHVIAVGIDKYPQQALQLKCAVADAKGLAEAFGEHCAGKDNLFGEARATTLLDAKAEKDAVLAALKKAREAVRPGDLLVFSFAGHGAREGRKFYLLTVDADPAKLARTALSGDELRAALADMPCQVLLLLDACHSAAGVRAFTPATDEAAGGLADDETGVAVLCAAMGSEEAQEKNGHGLFTAAVLEALRRANQVPYNYRDHRQYVHHLGSFVFDEVKDASHDEQHPFLTMPYVTESFAIRQLPP
jgi:WD40 repeat protein